MLLLLLCLKRGNLLCRLFLQGKIGSLFIRIGRIVLLPFRKSVLLITERTFKDRNLFVKRRIRSNDLILGGKNCTLPFDLAVFKSGFLSRNPLIKALFPVIGVNKPSLSNLLTDLPDRIKGRKRILEDPADLVTTDPMEFTFFDLGEVFSFIPYLSAFDDGRGREDAHNSLRGNRLSGSGLTDDAECLSLMQIKGDATDGMDQSFIRLKRYTEILYGKDDRRLFFFTCHD